MKISGKLLLVDRIQKEYLPYCRKGILVISVLCGDPNKLI